MRSKPQVKVARWKPSRRSRVGSQQRETRGYEGGVGRGCLFSWLGTQKMPVHEQCPGICVYVFSLDLVLQPVLEFSPSHPVEGHSMTLTCRVQLLAQRPYIQFRFCFFGDGRVLGSGCSSSPKLQIPAVWRKSPKSYRCAAEATAQKVTKWSLTTKIPVQSECLHLLFQSQSWVTKEQNRMSPALLRSRHWEELPAALVK